MPRLGHFFIIICLQYCAFYGKILEKEKGFFMKKSIKKFGFAAILMLVFIGAANAAAAGAGNSQLCALVEKLGGLLKTLRILAFIGAGFTIAGWAWGWISAGEVKMEDVKKKGIGLLVGAFVLFGVGTALTFLANAAGPAGSLGCVSAFQGWS